ncbi:DUF6151 family protein [Primorskyibacter sp. 2E233]|uniref:DUF6151 family protein n=1 Tax=Primorskyibacter sp. 2E233 TaxID=3413431 RepID=UPI003BF266F6
MTVDRTLSCKCGSVQWQVEPQATGTHLACYCNDCQAYARHLGTDETYLDAQGGTEIFQTTPANLRFLKGDAHLKCLRLRPDGLLRWYADCCKSPIGNTLNSPALPFVGLVLPAGGQGFGPIRARVNTGSAKGAVQAKGLAVTVVSFLWRAALAKLSGAGRRTPFFDASGAPMAAPLIVSEEQA